MSDAAKVQALPVTNLESQDVLESLREIVAPAIFAQLEERVALGVKKYGTRLQSHNGRDVLLDCRQEALDGCMYARQATLEDKSKGQLMNRFLAIIELIDNLERP